MVQVCLNGARTAADSPAVPLSPAALARSAAEAVAAGATDLHVHPKTPCGRDTLAPDAVAATLEAIRERVDVPVGVTTGAWAEDGPTTRVDRVRRWTVLPDHASVNWHEPGAEELAAALLDRGVGVEAGIWSGTDGAARFAASPLARGCLVDQAGSGSGVRCRTSQGGGGSRCGASGTDDNAARCGAGRREPGLIDKTPPGVLRVLAEVTDPDPATAVRSAHALLADLAAIPHGRPVLLHGEEASTWPVLALAVRLGHPTRIGLEDTLVLPDGRRAASNAELVTEALRRRGRAQRSS
ncbi:3-keto-5-aminohexanoate cleavage protein [Streptomyces longwoodensis]|uniref:3-keto-5-aminohexanoate cleavage protein n=1 Tax=Streptomyces longwoodensis TaxID=68231 RepID=UPI0033DCDAD3